MPQAHEEPLADADGERDNGHAEDGAQHERAPHYLVCYGEEHEVERVGGYGHRDKTVGGEIDKCRDARHTSDHDLVGQDACREADGIEREAQDDQKVVFGVDQQTVVPMCS